MYVEGKRERIGRKKRGLDVIKSDMKKVGVSEVGVKWKLRTRVAHPK